MDDERFRGVVEILFDAEDLCDDGYYDDAIDLCDQVVEACDEDGIGDPKLPEVIAGALLCRATSEAGLECFDDEMTTYDEIVGRFEFNETPAVIRHVARARSSAAVATGRKGLVYECMTKYAAFVDRYQANEDPEIVALVARARFNRARALKDSPRREEALFELDALILRYSDSKGWDINVTVAVALSTKAGLELEMNRPVDAIDSARRGLEVSGPELPQNRLHCHVVLAVAHLMAGDTDASEREAASILNILPEACAPDDSRNLRFIVVTLQLIGEAIGTDRILDLIQRSPSLEMISSFLMRSLDEPSQDHSRGAGATGEILQLATDLQTELAYRDRNED